MKWSALIGGNGISSELIMRIYSTAVDTLNIRGRGRHFDLLNIAGRDTGPGGIERTLPQKSNKLGKSEITPKLTELRTLPKPEYRVWANQESHQIVRYIFDLVTSPRFQNCIAIQNGPSGSITTLRSNSAKWPVFHYGPKYECVRPTMASIMISRKSALYQRMHQGFCASARIDTPLGLIWLGRGIFSKEDPSGLFGPSYLQMAQNDRKPMGGTSTYIVQIEALNHDLILAL